MKRQQIRRLLIIISLVLFPVTLYYFSPALIIQGALDGIIVGSFIVFSAMLVLSIFFGRFFCGYLCPAGGLQGCISQVNSKPAKQGFRNYIKFIIWAIWIAGIIVCFIFRKNTITLNIFYQTEYGISVTDIYGYVIYYGIVVLILVPALIMGRRAFCHYFCWMAPFMIIGSKIGRLLHIKRLELSVDKDKCTNCKACDKACPMGLNVSQKVKTEKIYDDECILCGECVDKCPKKAITFKFLNRKKKSEQKSKEKE